MDDAYQNALTEFVSRHGIGVGREGMVQAFHAVRNLDYASGGDRTPLTALKTGKGACTAKHIILRDLLRELGFVADVEFVEGDFTSAIPVLASMPDPLRGTIEAGDIKDIHCWVRLSDGGTAIRLDATWPDTLSFYGFTVNSEWDGQGDTAPALLNGNVKGTAEDVLAHKALLLEELTAEETTARKVFLGQLTAWLSNLPQEQERGRG